MPVNIISSNQSTHSGFARPAQSRRSSAFHAFLEAHPIGEMARSLFLSSVLWVFLGITVYSVYSYFIGAH